ncbi:AMIN domain-containing protein [Sulfurimonas sp.]
MIKAFLLISVYFVLLQARENPFFPINSDQDIPVTSNQVNTLPKLKRATVVLPSTARVIESVSVEYKNIDGSIAHKKVVLKNAIDWHLPIFISQNYNESNNNITAKKQKSKHTQKVHYKKIASLKFISFYADKNRLKIVTKDKMLRNFLLVKPHRIVCDFKRDTDLGSYVKNAYKNSLFTKIRVGTHKGYYRVVIELDGYYTYTVHQIQNGYLIQLL